MKRPLLLGLGSLAGAALGLFACAHDDAIALTSDEEPSPLPALDGSTGADASPEDASDANAWSPCSGFGFCLLDTELPPLVALNAITGTAADDVWIVGTKGTVLHGSGTSFAPVPAGTDESLFSVWSPARDNVWISASSAPLHGSAKEGGGVKFERVPGSTWNPSGATGGRIWTVWGSSADDVWLAGEPSSRFGGNASVWQLTSDDAGAPGWRSVSICAPGKFCSPNIRASWGSPNGPAWLVGSRGENYTPEVADGGTLWASKDSRTLIALESVWGAPNGEAWAVGAGGTVRRFAPDKNSWEVIESPVSTALHGVWGRNADDVWIVGDEGVVLHWTGKALELETMHDRTTVAPDLNAIWGIDRQIWIVGNGVIFHAADAGSP
ncbi:MAG: hypothetical protein BGO98_00745 [Myxococcales bacterium 68-20]|nr:hypothetical protein [Myxococcales bacterium]OJY17462.1 MAG: hypothetical protein BGO98_00745 [Myxococcales bacterium 68-20]